MALPAATVFEVRTTGSDSNGGGFVAGASGTDYSQQDSAQYSGTNLVIDGTTNTKVTSATHNFVATDVGNLIQITAGTGFTTGFYQIVSVASNAATLDRSAGTLGSTGGTFAVGGALVSIGKASSGAVTGCTIYLKAGTYSITSASTNVAGGCMSPAASSVKVVGYSATRGDAPTGSSRPVLQASGITSFTIYTANSSGSIENVILDGNSLTSGRGMSGGGGRAYNCKAVNCKNNGFNSGVYVFCEASGCSGSNTAGFASCTTMRCYSHDHVSSCNGFDGGMNTFSIAYNCNGSGFSDGAAGSMSAANCSSYGNAGDGFKLSAGAGNSACVISNCIAYGNTGFGVRGPSSDSGRSVYSVFVGSNTAGAVTGTYNGSGQVTLTADPFTNAAGGDFSLNNTAGGGAAVRGAGVPGTFPGISTTGYSDGGAVQHQDAGGGISRARQVMG